MGVVVPRLLHRHATQRRIAYCRGISARQPVAQVTGECQVLAVLVRQASGRVVIVANGSAGGIGHRLDVTGQVIGIANGVALAAQRLRPAPNPAHFIVAVIGVSRNAGTHRSQPPLAVRYRRRVISVSDRRCAIRVRATGSAIQDVVGISGQNTAGVGLVNEVAVGVISICLTLTAADCSIASHSALGVGRRSQPLQRILNEAARLSPLRHVREIVESVVTVSRQVVESIRIFINLDQPA